MVFVVVVFSDGLKSKGLGDSHGAVLIRQSVIFVSHSGKISGSGCDEEREERWV